MSTKKSSVKPLPSALARSGSSTSAAAPAAPRRALASQGSFAALAQMEEDKKAEKKKKKEKKVRISTPLTDRRRQGVHGLDAEWISDSRVFYVCPCSPTGEGRQGEEGEEGEHSNPKVHIPPPPNL